MDQCYKCGGRDILAEGNKQICRACGHVNVTLDIQKGRISTQALFARINKKLIEEKKDGNVGS